MKERTESRRSKTAHHLDLSEPTAAAPGPGRKPPGEPLEGDPLVARLEDELDRTQQQLQHTIEQLRERNEQLQTSNAKLLRAQQQAAEYERTAAIGQRQPGNRECRAPEED